MKKAVVVIGGGRFGSNLAITLEKIGNEVMVIDKSEDIINSISNKVTHSVICDVRVEGSLRELGLSNFDICVVALSSDYETAIIATLEAKKLGISKVIAKARDDLQATVLKMIGADRVIIPEKDMGIRLANTISNSNILDSINISDEYSLAEIPPIDEWIGKTLIESEIRNKYNLNIVAIKNKEDIKIDIDPNYIIRESDILLVTGKNDEISELV